MNTVQIPHCESCFYVDNEIKVFYECCCECDRLTVLADETNMKEKGFICLSNGDWIKKPQKKLRQRKLK